MGSTFEVGKNQYTRHPLNYYCARKSYIIHTALDSIPRCVNFIKSQNCTRMHIYLFIHCRISTIILAKFEL